MSLEPTVYIVDDEPAILDLLSAMLTQKNIANESFASAEAFLETCKSNDLRYGCILLDIGLPGISGMELQTELANLNNNLPIVFLTGQGTIESGVEAMKAGAIDFITKPFKYDALINAVQTAIAKCEIVNSEYLLRVKAKETLAKLAPRELEVMLELITGANDKLVARKLGISYRTVELYKANIRYKTEVFSLIELWHLAKQAGYTITTDVPVN